MLFQRSIAPCNCLQSFIFLLFEDKEKSFEETFVKCFQKVKSTGKVENGMLQLLPIVKTVLRLYKAYRMFLRHGVFQLLRESDGIFHKYPQIE